MTRLKKILALAIAAMMVFAMSLTVFGANDGSITVTNATAGQTYKAFLIFTASPSVVNDLDEGVSYTATAAQIAIDGFDDIFDTIEDENGNYTVSKKSGVSDDAVIAFIAANKDALKQGSEILGTVAEDATVTFSNLAYGYYYITSSLGTLISVDTAAKDVEVVDKNESNPTGPEKTITAETSSIDESLNQTNVTVEENDVAVGSVESFSVTFNATNWVQAADAQTAGTGDQADKHKALVWKFKDTPTNLEIDPETVVVTVNGVTISTEPTVDETTGALTFSIPWVDEDENFLYETKTSGSALIPVVVTYNAKILPGAASAPAPNDVEISYDRDDTEDVVLGSDTTTTYTYKFKIDKQDENGGALEGAEFQLFFGEQTDPLTFTVAEGKYRFDPEGSVTNIKPVKGEGNDAVAEVIGLDNASYVLKEVVVPAGYNKAEDTPVTGLTKEEGNTADITTITVENQKGSVLPSTGGIGTTIFYIVGGVIVVGAVIVLVARRKKSNTNK